MWDEDDAPTPLGQIAFHLSQSVAVMAGALTDLSILKPSSGELARMMALKSHTSAAYHLHRWYEMHWRERHAWLTLIEARATQTKGSSPQQG